MQYDQGTFSQGSVSNNVRIPCPFEPEEIELIVSRKASGAETGTTHLSIGHTNNDGSVQKTHCIFGDSTTVGYTQYYDQYCIAHIARVSGSITRVLSASYQGYDNVNNECIYNFDAADSNYQITQIARA